MWGFHQFHVRFVRGSAPFSHITIQAAADNIFPSRWPATTFRHDVVEAKAVQSKPFTTILAAVFVAEENIPAVEFHAIARHAVISEQSDNSGNLNFKIDGPNPVGILSVVQFQFQQANFQPVSKVVRMKSPIVDGDDFGGPLIEEAERTGDRENMDR